MKYVDEFRDRGKAVALIGEIRRLLARSKLARQRVTEIGHRRANSAHTDLPPSLRASTPQS